MTVLLRVCVINWTQSNSKIRAFTESDRPGQAAIRLASWGSEVTFGASTAPDFAAPNLEKALSPEESVTGSSPVSPTPLIGKAV